MWQRTSAIDSIVRKFVILMEDWPQKRLISFIRWHICTIWLMGWSCKNPLFNNNVLKFHIFSCIDVAACGMCVIHGVFMRNRNIYFLLVTSLIKYIVYYAHVVAGPGRIETSFKSTNFASTWTVVHRRWGGKGRERWKKSRVAEVTKRLGNKIMNLYHRQLYAEVKSNFFRMA